MKPNTEHTMGVELGGYYPSVSRSASSERTTFSVQLQWLHDEVAVTSIKTSPIISSANSDTNVYDDYTYYGGSISMSGSTAYDMSISFKVETPRTNGNQTLIIIIAGVAGGAIVIVVLLLLKRR